MKPKYKYIIISVIYVLLCDLALIIEIESSPSQSFLDFIPFLIVMTLMSILALASQMPPYVLSTFACMHYMLSFGWLIIGLATDIDKRFDLFIIAANLLIMGFICDVLKKLNFNIFLLGYMRFVYCILLVASLIAGLTIGIDKGFDLFIIAANLILGFICGVLAKLKYQDQKTIQGNNADCNKETQQESFDEASQVEPQAEQTSIQMKTLSDDENINFVAEIQTALHKINDKEIRQKVSKLKNTVNSVLIFNDCPDKVDRLEGILNSYIPSILKLLNLFIELDKQKDLNIESFGKLKEKVLKITDTTRQILDTQLAKCYQDKAMNIIVEADTIEQTMRLRGLIDDLYQM